MLCLCDNILNILHSLLERLTKLSEHPKGEGVRKPTSVSSTILQLQP